MILVHLKKQSNVANFHNNDTCKVILNRARVDVFDDNGKGYARRVLRDSASQPYITSGHLETRFRLKSN